MQPFDYWAIVLAIINCLVLTISGLIGIVVKLDKKQQATELDAVRSRVTALEAAIVSKELVTEKFTNLSKLLENYVKGLERKIDDDKHDNDEKFDRNDSDHDKLMKQMEAGFETLREQIGRLVKAVT